MEIFQVAQKMILQSKADRRVINHFLKVTAYARQIAEAEGMTGQALKTLVTAALMHDIAVPYCREKYGHCQGPFQEKEGGPMVTAFFAGTDMEEEIVSRVRYLVEHHHTLTQIDGLDYQILIEADYLVNADEGAESPEAIRAMEAKVFKTAAGRALLQSMFL